MKKFVLPLAALSFLASVQSPAYSQESIRADRILSAQQLRDHCSESEGTEAGRLSIGYCLGAITGIADASMTLNATLAGRQTICLDSDDSADKMRLSFLVFTEQQPETLDLPAATVVIAMLQSYFGCGPTK